MSDEGSRLKALGNAAYQRKEYAEAIELYTRCLEVEGRNHVIYSNRSLCHYCAGEYEAALRDAEECIGLAAGFVKGYSRKGNALIKLKRLEEAKAAFERGLEIERGNEACVTGAREVEILMGSRGREERKGWQKIFDRGIEIVERHPLMQRYGCEADLYGKIRMVQSLESYPEMMVREDERLRKVEAIASGADEEEVWKIGTSGGQGSSGANPHGHSWSGRGSFLAGRKGAGAGAGAGAGTRVTKTEEEEMMEWLGMQWVGDGEASLEDRRHFEAEAAKERGNKKYRKRELGEAARDYVRAVVKDREWMLYRLNLAAALVEMANEAGKEAEGMEQRMGRGERERWGERAGERMKEMEEEEEEERREREEKGDGKGEGEGEGDCDGDGNISIGCDEIEVTAKSVDALVEAHGAMKELVKVMEKAGSREGESGAGEMGGANGVNGAREAYGLEAPSLSSAALQLVRHRRRLLRAALSISVQAVSMGVGGFCGIGETDCSSTSLSASPSTSSPSTSSPSTSSPSASSPALGSVGSAGSVEGVLAGEEQKVEAGQGQEAEEAGGHLCPACSCSARVALPFGIVLVLPRVASVQAQAQVQQMALHSPLDHIAKGCARIGTVLSQLGYNKEAHSVVVQGLQVYRTEELARKEAEVREMLHNAEG
ncbi:putative stress-induced-phosphoprotein [Monocercomonoides exilis]|uniref:putative stress-induced-phosphoprotein n=1 Tax=Monocercomonoides exilis TaxID=2049356 RepID=UPI00355A73DC|nr:putative stress-induced-phosphoprotein [Monocercomonoides exilis]|eukprot:MONOS_14927.1-p1 / transcript=MONOS_14927.1 / gene=MONOS_14927 / organism=Monocercomonoides_exilis_PA203 / gene_product=stress-induced-phosphoprotein / transcript_product=stress-induced-phosphoprotein / location=Mono_scaffold01107:8920-11068(-) / protein_length=658 / sequence_SO=supercontig / SO=protein_coding / is_pseudo=false